MPRLPGMQVVAIHHRVEVDGFVVMGFRNFISHRKSRRCPKAFVLNARGHLHAEVVHLQTVLHDLHSLVIRLGDLGSG